MLYNAVWYNGIYVLTSDATELEIGELSRAEPSWHSFRHELSRAGYFQKRAEYELTYFQTNTCKGGGSH